MNVSGMKGRLLIIAPKKMSETTKLIMEEAKRRFRVKFAPINEVVVKIDRQKQDVVYNNRSLMNVDYFLPKIDGKRAAYGYKIVKAFDFSGIKHPYTAETLRIAHDKFLSTFVLKTHGLPVPETYAIKSLSSLKAVAKKLDFPVIVKILSGSGGKGVMFVENEEQLMSVCGSMEALKQEVVIQEYIKNPGEDIRLLVLGNEAVAGMKRIACNGDKRANISAGGKGVLYEPDDEMKEIAIKTAEAVDARILAVDMVVDEKGNPFIIEINVNPGIRGLMKATDRNIAKMIVEFIEEEMGISKQ